MIMKFIYIACTLISCRIYIYIVIVIMNYKSYKVIYFVHFWWSDPVSLKSTSNLHRLLPCWAEKISPCPIWCKLTAMTRSDEGRQQSRNKKVPGLKVALAKVSNHNLREFSIDFWMRYCSIPSFHPWQRHWNVCCSSHRNTFLPVQL